MDEDTLPQSENQAIIDLCQKLGNVQRIDDEDLAHGRVLGVPEGVRLESLKPILDSFRLEPERRKGQAQLTTLSAFIAHVNRFKDEDSAVYLDDTNQEQPALVSVLNYHRKGNGRPRFGDHRGVYHFPLSEEWKAWTGRDGDEMAQGDFAAFLEDRLPDVLAPGAVGQKTQEFAAAAGIQFATQARLLELSKGLSIKVDTQVTQSVNLSTGEAQIVYQEQHGDASSVKVPSGFAIQIPVVRNGPVYQIPVRLRYRVLGGRVLWKFALYRTDLIFEAMVSEALERVEKETELPCFRGKPE